LVRKLFEKAGCPISNRNVELPVTGFDNAAHWRLVYTKQNPITVGFSTGSVNSVDSWTFTQFIDNFAYMYDHIIAYLSDTDDDEPYQLALYSIPIAISDVTRLIGKLDLTTEVIEIHASSRCKIQNRSSGSQATTTDRYQLDRVDNQPLHGYLYEFKHADPRLKQASSFFAGSIDADVWFNRIGVNGITLVRANQIPFIEFAEPPVPAVFANCAKSSKVAIQPGDMKYMMVTTKEKGLMVNLLKKMKCGVRVNDYMTGLRGKSQLLALEERIRTDSENPITLQYERESKVGCLSYSTKPTAITTVLGVNLLNNV